MENNIEMEEAKKKFSYIWYYYKVHIFIAIFLVYVVFTGINYWIINKPKKVISRIIVYEKNINQKKVLDLEKFLNESLSFDKEKSEIKVEGWDLNAPLGLDEKIKFMVAAQQIDAIITKKETFERYKKFEIFGNIKTEETIKENKMIKVSSKLKMNKGNLIQESYIGIVSNSLNKEVVKKVIDLIEHY